MLLAGCGSTRPPAAAPKQQPVAAPTAAAAETTTTSCRSGYEPLRSARLAWAAVVRRPAPVYRRTGGAPLARLATRNANGVPMALGVLGRSTPVCGATWYRVQLPMRPNGAVGWIRAEDVTLAPVRTRIVVDLSARQLDLYRGGRLILRARTAIGAAGTPTPTGSFYVNQRLRAPDPSGPYGPGGIGISAFSPVLTNWVQGGPIAIHGTNAPSAIGQAVSHGCVRIRNGLVSRLFRLVPAGTPVTIRQ